VDINVFNTHLHVLKSRKTQIQTQSQLTRAFPVKVEIDSNGDLRIRELLSCLSIKKRKMLTCYYSTFYSILKIYGFFNMCYKISMTKI